ncbi:MAG: DEAD/DEAH box helicase family protein [Opitutaceae bacterium]
MRLKEYQKRAEAELQAFLVRLATARDKEAKARAIDPDLAHDFVAKAWEQSRLPSAYLPRKTGIDEPPPGVCLKVPTGGGKTLLAVRAIGLVNSHYRRRANGLVLWIVPSTQIFNQTWRALKDRAHPYRQHLDLVSAGRTLVLEKASGFSPAEVEENLCVLLLMLPSANRESKDQLRMFRDSGGYDRFFPRDDDVAGHRELLKEVPNLDTFEKHAGFGGRQIKTSLGNTLRILRPLVILDEGHKAYSVNARATLEGFNPCLMLELSATPPKEANILVEITGRELLDAEMIKLDLHLADSPSPNWRDTLLAAVEHRNWLEQEADTYRNETNHDIRPICLIQVERTGKDPARAGCDSRGRRERVSLAASGNFTGAHRDQDEPEGRTERGGRCGRAHVTGVPDSLHHHQAGATGRLGLRLRLRAGDPHESGIAERAYAARRPHLAATGWPKNRPQGPG